MAHVQSPQQFLTDFLHLARQATKRIYLQAMIVESGHVFTEVEPILLQKAKEGVDVHIATDWIAHRYAGDDVAMMQPLWGSSYRRMRDFQNRSAISEQKLIQHGAKYTVLNRFNPLSFVFPIFKRNHRKIYIVDDVAWIGGINFFDKGFEVIDFMVQLANPDIVAVLAKAFQQVNDQRAGPNEKLTCTDEYEVLLDNGLIGKSIIYDEAVSLIEKAKESVLFVSQFIPDGRLLDALLHASERGVQSMIITDQKAKRYFTKFPYNIPYQRFQEKIKGEKTIHLFHHHQPIHAKLLIVDGKTAIFGSHNLVNIGVLLGTKEIAIKTTDTKLIRDLQQFMQNTTVLSMSKS